MFRAVLDPPRDNGISWSYSRFRVLPHLTHLPPSRCHTNIFTLSGIGSRPCLAARSRALASAMKRSRLERFRDGFIGMGRDVATDLIAAVLRQTAGL